MKCGFTASSSFSCGCVHNTNLYIFYISSLLKVSNTIIYQVKIHQQLRSPTGERAPNFSWHTEQGTVCSQSILVASWGDIWWEDSCARNGLHHCVLPCSLTMGQSNRNT